MNNHQIKLSDFKDFTSKTLLASGGCPDYKRLQSRLTIFENGTFLYAFVVSHGFYLEDSYKEELFVEFTDAVAAYNKIPF